MGGRWSPLAASPDASHLFGTSSAPYLKNTIKIIALLGTKNNSLLKP